MGTTRHTLRAAVFLVLEREGKVLLARRAGTTYYEGYYGLPSGHMDGNETPTEAAVREGYEEVGLQLQPAALRFAHVMHRIAPDLEYVDFYFVVSEFEGEPINREPEKCDDLLWAAYDDLPENVIPEVREALMAINNGVDYSEYRDDQPNEHNMSK